MSFPIEVIKHQSVNYSAWTVTKYNIVTFSSYSIAICCISADCSPIMEPNADDDNVTCDETFDRCYKQFVTHEDICIYIISFLKEHCACIVFM